MIALTPIVKSGNKKVIHVIASNSKELNGVVNFLKHPWGIRNAGTDNEHLTVSLDEANIIAHNFEYVQLEQDILFHKEGEI